MNKDQLISWFCSLSQVDMLSLYEGRQKLGVDTEEEEDD